MSETAMTTAKELNYYQLLEVDPQASVPDITAAFNRKLQDINDRNAVTKIEELQILIEAFAILSNQEKRIDYDVFLKTGQAITVDLEEPRFSSTSLVERIRFETTGADLEKKAPLLIEKISHVLKRVQDQTVRLRYRGKQIGPDIPMQYAIALEALGLLGSGIVRTVVANLGVKTLFDVEVVSLSEERIKTGDNFYQRGELDLAEKEYLAALDHYEKSALACLKLGILKKIQAQRDEAIYWFKKALALGPETELAKEAQRNLDRL